MKSVSAAPNLRCFPRVLAPICSVAATSFVLLTIYMLDEWLGLLAYPLHYIACALGLAGILALPSFLHSTRVGSIVGGLALFALLTPYAIPAPSARLLRSVMIAVPLGATEDVVRAAIADAYAESDYEPPLIQTEESGRIHVSLSNQCIGDCTALSFLTEDGHVVHKAFSAD